VSLRRYAEFCDRILEELGNGWTESRLQQLAERLRTLGYPRWERWRTAHAAAVHDLLAAAPKRQSALLAKAEEPDLLCLAGIQAALEARALLLQAEVLADGVGAGYRSLAAEAARCHAALQDEWPAYPLEGHPGEYPECLILAVRALFSD